MKNWLVKSERWSSYGGFSFKKRLFSEANISRIKADFDPKPPPMENMNLLLALYTHFRGVMDQRFAHKSPLKWTIFLHKYLKYTKNEKCS